MYKNLAVINYIETQTNSTSQSRIIRFESINASRFAKFISQMTSIVIATSNCYQFKCLDEYVKISVREEL